MKFRISDFGFRDGWARRALLFRLPFSVLSLLLLAGCASPKVSEAPMPDAQLAQYISSAGSAFALGSYDRAARFYALALQRARAMDESLEVGKQAYNLAASLVLAGDATNALPYLTEAESAFARLRKDRGPVVLLRARALRAVGDTEAARLEIQRVVELNTSEDIQCQGWLLYGQLSADAGDLDEAGKALSRARRLLSDDPALRAGVASLAGRLALLANNAGGAGLEYDKEAEFMRRARRYADMAEALRRAGAAYAADGDVDAAGYRFYRAARSWQGQGRPVDALRAVEQALALPVGDAEPAWGAAVAALVEEIRRTPAAGAPADALE